MIWELYCFRKYFCVVQDCFWHPLRHPATVGNLPRQCVFHGAVSHHAKKSRMVLNVRHVPLSFSKNRVHTDSASFGLIKSFLADLCTYISAHKPNEANRARKSSTACEMSGLVWTQCAFPMLRSRFSEGSTYFSSFLWWRSLNYQMFKSIETTLLNNRGMSNSHLSPSWRLLQPITRIKRELFEGFSHFVAYLRFSKEFLRLLY